jgi:hypothetical protein
VLNKSQVKAKSGKASVTAKANAIAGNYTVTVSAAGASPVLIHLTNH